MKVVPQYSFLLCLLINMAVFGYQTKNVVILVIDGARYTETFGDSTQTYIPYMWNVLRHQGTIFTRFYNDSITTTCSGHSTILTGTWQNLSNDGTMRPLQPTVFEYFRKDFGSSESESYVILGKPKLEILSYSNTLNYGAKYGAAVRYCENYTDDKLTWANICTVLVTKHPRLAVANLGQVDAFGHAVDSIGYRAAIRQADSIVGLTWNLLQNDPFYKDRTTLFVVNDHGRHTTEFSSHGDGCEGCRHIMCMMVGPDAAPGVLDSSYRRQTDIAPTVGELLGFSTPYAAGTALIPVLPPEPPFLSLPIAGAIDQPVGFSLTWQPVRSAGTYRLQIATDPVFLNPIIDTMVILKTIAAVRNLSVAKTYYWRVCARNAGGSGEWSDIREFITGNTDAPEITLVSPENGATLLADIVTLEWDASTTGVYKYWLEVATDSLMANVVRSDSSLTKKRIVFQIPWNDTSYWWRVRAGFSDGWAEVSPKQTFRAEVPRPEWPPEAYVCSFTMHSMTERVIEVAYALVNPGDVAVSIYTMGGRRVAPLYRSHSTPIGRYVVRVNLSAIPAGCFVLEFVTDGFAKRAVMALP